MEVILMKHIENLGRRGEVVRVAPGFARNFLLPRRMAVLATAGAKRLVEQESRKFQAQDAKAHENAAAVAARLASATLKIAVKADEDGKLYGSIGAHEIAEALMAEDFDVSRKQIIIDHPFKQLGEYEVGVKLHHDVRGSVKLNIEQE